jgi:hypothetical protein
MIKLSLALSTAFLALLTAFCSAISLSPRPDDPETLLPIHVDGTSSSAISFGAVRSQHTLGGVASEGELPQWHRSTDAATDEKAGEAPVQ